MEDYIFIIIAIILSAIGAFNRNKKQKMARMKEEGETNHQQPSIFKDFMDDSFFNDEPEPAVIQKPATVPAPSVKKQFEPIKREPIIKKAEEVKKQKPILLEEEPEVESSFDPIMKDFSLKKAVIYSEILNRKY